MQEVEYKPVSVKELLTEMKDISELMIDLAYSAVLFNNQDLAEEVYRLEEKMDYLNYQIRLAAMLAARTVEDAEQLTGILQIGAAAEDISNAAGDVVNVVTRGMELHPAVRDALDKVEEKIYRFHVSKGSILAGKTLGEVALAKNTGMYVIAIRRADQWICGPGKKTQIKADDTLIARGRDEGAKILQKIVTGEQKEL